jgi:hypothetical protein
VSIYARAFFVVAACGNKMSVDFSGGSGVGEKRRRGPAKKTLEAARENLLREIQTLTANESREIDLIQRLEREIAVLRSSSSAPSPEITQRLDHVTMELRGKHSKIAELDGECTIIKEKLDKIRIELREGLIALNETDRASLDDDVKTARQNEVKLRELISKREKIIFEIDTITRHQAMYDKRYGEVYKNKLKHDDLKSVLESKEAEKEKLHIAARKHDVEIGHIKLHIQSTGSQNPRLLEMERLLVEKQRNTTFIQSDKAQKVAEVQRLEQEIFRLNSTSRSGGGGKSSSSSLYSPQAYASAPHPPHSYAALAALQQPHHGSGGFHDMTMMSSPYSGGGGSAMMTSPHYGGGGSAMMTSPHYGGGGSAMTSPHYGGGGSAMTSPHYGGGGPPPHYHNNNNGAMGGYHNNSYDAQQQQAGVATAIGYPISDDELLRLCSNLPPPSPGSPFSPDAAGQRSSMDALAAVASRERAAASRTSPPLRTSPPRHPSKSASPPLPTSKSNSPPRASYDIGLSLLSPGGPPPQTPSGFGWLPQTPAAADFYSVAGGGQPHYPDTPFTSEMHGLGF